MQDDQVRAADRREAQGQETSALPSAEPFAELPKLQVCKRHGGLIPKEDAALRAIEFLPNGTLKIYKGLPHGMCTTHPDVINADLLAFIEDSVPAEGGTILAEPA